MRVSPLEHALVAQQLWRSFFPRSGVLPLQGEGENKAQGQASSGLGWAGLGWAGLLVWGAGQCSPTMSTFSHRTLRGKCVCPPNIARATPHPCYWTVAMASVQ